MLSFSKPTLSVNCSQNLYWTKERPSGNQRQSGHHVSSPTETNGAKWERSVLKSCTVEHLLLNVRNCLSHRLKPLKTLVYIVSSCTVFIRLHVFFSSALL